MQTVQQIASALCYGGTVCLTGEMEDCDRAKCLRVFNAVGLLVSSSVSKHTAFLIAAKGAQQRKIDRANELGIPVCTSDDFWKAVYLTHPSNENSDSYLPG